MNKLKKVFIVLFLLIIYITISTASYANTVSSNIANNVFRLHVVANSNTNEDQALKYLVRDEVISFVNNLNPNISSKEDMIDLVKTHSELIKNHAKKIIKKEGYNYDVNINIGNFSFPTKYYGDISLPSGYYDALKIEIGNATGENWWCVMFPPLCFIDITSGIVPEESKADLKNNLEEEEFALISKDEELISFKFMLVEMFENLSISLGII